MDHQPVIPVSVTAIKPTPKAKQGFVSATVAWLLIERVLLLLPYLRRDFQAQAVQSDEARGVVLVVGLGWVGFHRGDVRIVEADRRLTILTMMLPL